jgi:hypothetical protein
VKIAKNQSLGLLYEGMPKNLLDEEEELFEDLCCGGTRSD